MTLYVGQAAALELLTDLVTDEFNGAILHLFKTNYTPVAGDLLANYTEANFGGYAAITLNSWGTAFTDGDGKARVEETVRTFTASGAVGSNDIYGYYVTDAAGTELLYAERAASPPFTINTVGQTYTVLPRVTLVTG